jgi:hypothetical protein
MFFKHPIRPFRKGEHAWHNPRRNSKRICLGSDRWSDRASTNWSNCSTGTVD